VEIPVSNTVSTYLCTICDIAFDLKLLNLARLSIEPDDEF